MNFEAEISIGELRSLCVSTLTNFDVNFDIASKVVNSLIQYEYSGYQSHGLLRLPDYIYDIQQKRLLPSALPKTSKLGPQSYQVDGQRGFGHLAADAISDALLKGLKEGKLASVSLINCNHIGRLLDVANPITEAGYLMIGFCNCLGAGQKVIPPGGKSARLCTNPMVFAAPNEGHKPITLDLTTSAVSEGKVRAKMLQGKEVPEGWLQNEDGHVVNDPKKLYEQPPSAFLSPLGGQLFGHKGFGLAMFSEIFAGILTGAGYCTNKVAQEGNGGFFIGIDPTIGGQNKSCVLQNIATFSSYIRSAGTQVRLPGEKEPLGALDLKMKIKVSSVIIAEIIRLGNS